MPRNPLILLAVVLSSCLLLVAACGGGGDGDAADLPAEVGEAERAENERLGYAVVVPPGSPFELVSNDGDEIRLRFPGDDEYSPGEVVFSAYPEQDYGVNLYEQVNQRKEELEAMPDGEFFGQVELGSHLGSAFNTRGRYTGEDGQEVEEIKIFAVHPSANRILHMTYRYAPAPGQTEARMMDQAFEAFGYVEPMVVEEEEGAPAEEGAEVAAEGAEES